MLKARIPLDRIYRVFFSDECYSDSENEDSSISSADVPVPEVMNDYTVIRLGDKPIPIVPPLPKYPKMKKTVIKNEAPSTYYSVKISPTPIPEYVPPARKIPRKINPNNFKKSAYKREFCGKTPFEQDLIIMKHRKEMWEEFCPVVPDPNTIEPKKNVKPPQMYQREEEQRYNWAHDVKIQQIEEELKQKEKEEARERKFRRDAQRLKSDVEERKQISTSEMESAKEEQKQWEIQEKERIREKWKSFVPDKPTRASQLKDESCRRKLEKMFIDERREKLNEEMRKEIEAEQMKKLSITLLRLKPSDENQKSADKMRREMQKNTRLWNRWLKLTEQDIGRQTMLERIYEEHENLQFAKEEKAEMNAEK